ncbi:DNA-binding domain-containing protein [Vogesella sp. LYT5W]|uniref:DNA-binding domain-containing protein n=1 Tax=Vogesella margarita TaxID=2984199 RepID=A0ABT5ISJ8_9NEIS|nr:DNA-binding domain-containing protein [Vogesella margarita]MDC7715546.1 DNA-binding domain-containing protein [Vogesella margarita]
MNDAQRWQHELLDAITAPQWQDHPTLPANALAVYRNNYRVGLMEMLALAYPIVQQLLSAEFFGALSREFVRATPSHSGNLHRYGAGFTDFIAGFAPASEWPYLPDVARMEWALHRGYYAPDSARLEVASLAALPPAQWGALRLPLDASLSLLRSPWALSAIHAYHQPGATQQPFTLARAENLLLWREHGRMQLRAVDDAPAAFLLRLQQGDTLDEATTAALSVAPDFALQETLLTGLQHGWFAQP